MPRAPNSSARSTIQQGRFFAGCDGFAFSHRLARAFRPGDDRSHGLRHARHCLSAWIGAGSHRERSSTGFVVENEEEAIAAVGRLHELDRRSIRAAFEKRFTARRMAQDYVSHYRELTRHTPRIDKVAAHPITSATLATGTHRQHRGRLFEGPSKPSSASENLALKKEARGARCLPRLSPGQRVRIAPPSGGENATLRETRRTEAVLTSQHRVEPCCSLLAPVAADQR